MGHARGSRSRAPRAYGEPAALARGRRVEAAVVAAAIAGGILWSNALAYREAWLAPRGQLAELERIGERFAGQGPTLMTSFEPYGVRHFLRRMDPEGASELRRRFVTLRNGELLPTGASADVDRIRLDELLVYRTLVLRRGPTASRPPSAYRLAWTGRYYEVWQRPATSVNAIVEHLSLGTGLQAGAVARCADVLRLARLARGGSLMAAVRPLTVEATSSPSAGEVVTSVELPASGVYTAWLRGDFFGRASVSVDGAPLGSKRHDLNWPDLYTPLGRRMLSAGAHLVRLRYDVGGWRPGSRGTPYSFGPLVLSPQDLREPVLDVPPARARMLCGRRLDWVEAVRSARNS